MLAIDVSTGGIGRPVSTGWVSVTEGFSKACRAEAERFEPPEKMDGGFGLYVRYVLDSFSRMVFLGETNTVGVRPGSAKVIVRLGIKEVSICGAGILDSSFEGPGLY